MTLQIVRTVDDLRAAIGNLRMQGHSIGLVPTMGALHDGHLSLVRYAKGRVGAVVVTLFVNPKQFAPTDDLATYPRNEQADANLLTGEGAALLFAPDISEVYPEGHATSVSVAGITEVLEGEYRPGFFNGVATVVSKLFLQAQPDMAVFGEKDYQQLQVIKRMTADLNIPVHIEGAPTIREVDGLAMSSRNAYLTAEERAIAPVLYKTLNELAEKARDGGNLLRAEAMAEKALLDAGFESVDYITVRDAATLGDWTDGTEGRALAAAKLGKARLIDNIAV